MNIREIASLAGVSAATVSLVLNGKKGVGEETRRRVRRILEEHKYVPEVGGARKPRRRLRFLKYRTHGMAVEENQGFISSIIDRIENECRHFGYDLAVTNCSAGNVKKVFRDLAEEASDGVILLGTEFGREYFGLLETVKLPLVVLDNSMRYENVDSVVMDNAHIAATAVKYLHRRGHRRIGYFKTSVAVSNLDERYEGYRHALEELGLPAEPPVFLTPTLNGAYADMKKALESGLYTPRGAVFADNDSIAIGATRALEDAGHRIPADLSIVGVDDIPFSSMTKPGLTTMRVSRSALGILTVDVIRKRIRHPDWPAMHVSIAGQLIERESVAEPGPA